MITDGYHHPLDLLTDSLKVCIGHLGTDQSPVKKIEIFNVVKVLNLNKFLVVPSTFFI